MSEGHWCTLDFLFFEPNSADESFSTSNCLVLNGCEPQKSGAASGCCAPTITTVMAYISVWPLGPELSKNNHTVALL